MRTRIKSSLALFPPVGVLTAAGLLCSGCSSIAASAASGLADNLSTAILNQDDPETVRDGAPAYLLLMDSFVETSPDNEEMLQAAANLYAAYGAVFVEDGERARRLTRRALRYGKRAMCIRHEAACTWGELDFDGYEEALMQLDQSDIASLYSYTVSWLAYSRAHSDDFKVLADLPKVEAALDRLYSLEPGYQDGNVHLYLGILHTLRPPALGGRPEEGRKHFERAIEASGGKNLGAKVEYARSYARLLYDRDLHDRLLKEVMEADAAAPGLTLFNTLAKREAQELLASADEYFDGYRRYVMPKRLVTALLLSLIGFAQSAAAAQVLKLATLAPEGSEWMKEMRAGAKEIKERTEGRVVLKFYGGGVMGNDKKVLRKIRIGQLHGGSFVASGVAEQYPDINLYGLPLLFESLDEVDYVRQRMDDMIEQGLEEAGWVNFGIAEGGMAMLMSNKPVRSLDDLERQKVWVPEGDTISYAAMEALGLSPVTLPMTDVLTGLQTGLIDIIGTSPVGALVFQWHTKVKYITRLPISYLIAVLAIDARVFNRLQERDQQIVREVMSRIYDEFDKRNREDNDKAIAALLSSGLQFVEPNPQEVPEWRATVGKANREQGEAGAFTPALLDELIGYVNEFRQGSIEPVASDGTP